MLIIVRLVTTAMSALADSFTVDWELACCAVIRMPYIYVCGLCCIVKMSLDEFVNFYSSWSSSASKVITERV